MSKKLKVEDISKHVRQLFFENQKDFLIYYNLAHTEHVVTHSTEIAAYYELTDIQSMALYAAAWFHDTGHLLNVMKGHEEISISLLKEFLETKNTDPEFIRLCSVCILSTKMPVKPVSLIEKILCDADTYHLGTPDFWRVDKLVWDELEIRLGEKVNNRLEKSLSFLEKHVFYTEYCQSILNQGKDTNIRILKERINNSHDQDTRADIV